MTITPNLGLKKPGSSDPIDISALNDNADAIDTFAGGVQTQLARFVVYDSGTQIEQDADLDTYTTSGTYYCNSADVSSVSNIPNGLENAFRLDVWDLPAERRQQRIYPDGSVPVVYIRNSLSTGWGSWYKFEGVEVT